MNDDYLTFAYEQADRKHRTGQKLSEDEWEALLAGERAKRAELEDFREAAEELEKEVERLTGELKDREDRIDELEDRIDEIDLDLSRTEDALADARADLAARD